LNDDAKALRESAERFFAGADTLTCLRQWRNDRDLTGAAHGVWGTMAELGFAATLIPEEFGGVGLDRRASVQISEIMGRTLANGPFVSSAVMAATALLAGNSAKLKTELLPAIAEGMAIALATEESARHAPHAIQAVAKHDSAGFRITGRKVAVIDGNIAQKLIVTAHTTDGANIVAMVDANTPGITLNTRMGLDSRPLVDVMLNDVHVPESDLICDPADTLTVLDAAYDMGRLHLAAEMLGAAQEAFDRAVEYLKTRVQFGKKIGEFQALQHRAAILFGELEIARSTVLKAAATGSAEHISMAKARVGDIARHVAGEAVQFHGGIGVTDDFDLGFFLKRIRVAAEQLGDSAFHTERYATIRGL